ncbi:Uncharacterized protein SCF082_LOCUS35861, partial [Durusdinium trenchii]
MPTSMRDDWDLAYKKARWPQVYAPGEFHRTHDAALGLQGLTDDQRGAIEAAMSQYVREAEPANKKWIDAIAEREEANREIGGEWTQEKWEAYEATREAVQQARTDRSELDDRFVERVLAVLTPEQREALPTNAGSGVDADEDVAAIDASDVRHYAELLSLDEEQQAAAIERYRVYRAEMREATNALRDMAMDQAIDSAKDLRENGIAGAYFRSFLRATADVDGSLDVYTKPQRIEHELIEDLVAFAVTPEQRAGVER